MRSAPLLLGVLLTGCVSPVLQLSSPTGRSASGPLGLREVVHQREVRGGELKPDQWRLGYRLSRAVQAGDVYELSMTSQVTSEAPHVKIECRLRVGQQIVGFGSSQSVSQPMATGGSHHSPLSALGLWTCEESGPVEFLAEFRAQPMVPTTQKVYLDAQTGVPYGHLSVLHWSRSPAAGLDAVFTRGEAVAPVPGQVAGWTRHQYLDYWRWPLQATRGDFLLLFAQTWARQKPEDEVEPYQRLYPQFDGEQVFTSLNLDHRPTADLHGENVCSQHPELQAFQEMALGPIADNFQSMRLQVCGAYGRGSCLSDRDTQGFALRLRPGAGLPLQEIREWKTPAGPASGVVPCQPGDWISLTALIQLETPPGKPGSCRADLLLGDQRSGAQRWLGENYQDGYLRLEAVCRAGSDEASWALVGDIQSGYCLMRRWAPRPSGARPSSTARLH